MQSLVSAVTDDRDGVHSLLELLETVNCALTPNSERRQSPVIQSQRKDALRCKIIRRLARQGLAQTVGMAWCGQPGSRGFYVILFVQTMQICPSLESEIFELFPMDFP